MTAFNTSDVPEWERLASVPGYQGFTTVRSDTYRLPDGTVSEWDVIEQRDTVAVIAVTQAGDAVLFAQFRVGPRAVLAELPGGLIDDGETPVQAAERELLEETGYAPRSVFHPGGEWAGANSTRRKYIVIAAGCHLVAEPHWEAGETGSVRVVAFEALFAHLLSGELSDAGEAVRALQLFARSVVHDPELAALQTVVRTALSTSGVGGVAPPVGEMPDALADFWDDVDLDRPGAAHDALEKLLQERGRDDARAAFERASLRDALGEEAAAIPLYRDALARGLTDPHHTQAVIQLASSLRNVGDASGAVALLQRVTREDPLFDSARAFLSLALYSDGKPARALRTALQTFAPRLPQYVRAVGAYAEELETPERIRAIAVGVLVRDGWILAEEYAGHDGERFLRVPGGGIEFGEPSDAAVRREFTEELAVELDSARLVGVTENIFRGHGKRGHEIVHVYEIRCAALEALERSARLAVHDAETTVGWYEIDRLPELGLPLYPPGVLDLAV